MLDQLAFFNEDVPTEPAVYILEQVQAEVRTKLYVSTRFDIQLLKRLIQQTTPSAGYVSLAVWRGEACLKQGRFNEALDNSDLLTALLEYSPLTMRTELKGDMKPDTSR